MAFTKGSIIHYLTLLGCALGYLSLHKTVKSANLSVDQRGLFNREEVEAWKPEEFED